MQTNSEINREAERLSGKVSGVEFGRSGDFQLKKLQIQTELLKTQALANAALEANYQNKALDKLAGAIVAASINVKKALEYIGDQVT